MLAPRGGAMKTSKLAVTSRASKKTAAAAATTRSSTKRAKSPARKTLRAKKIEATPKMPVIDTSSHLIIRTTQKGKVFVSGPADELPSSRNAAEAEEEEHLWETWSDGAAEKFVQKRQRAKIALAGCSSPKEVSTPQEPASTTVLDPAFIREHKGQPVITIHR